jgi:DNA primase
MGSVKKYGPDSCPAGPTLAGSDDIIIVEGRADIINLMKAGITNTIAVEGTQVPKTVVRLCKSKSATVFLDGDRGGDFILKELLQVGCDVDNVARAPLGKEVEDLSLDEIESILKHPVDVTEAVFLTGNDRGKPITIYADEKKVYRSRDRDTSDRKHVDKRQKSTRSARSRSERPSSRTERPPSRTTRTSSRTTRTSSRTARTPVKTPRTSTKTAKVTVRTPRAISRDSPRTESRRDDSRRASQRSDYSRDDSGREKPRRDDRRGREDRRGRTDRRGRDDRRGRTDSRRSSSRPVSRSESRKKPARIKVTVPEQILSAVNELGNSMEAILLNNDLAEIERTTSYNLAKVLTETQDVGAVIYDGILTQRIIDTAVSNNINYVIATILGKISEKPSSVKIISFDQIKQSAA